MPLYFVNSDLAEIAFFESCRNTGLSVFCFPGLKTILLQIRLYAFTITAA